MDQKSRRFPKWWWLPIAVILLTGSAILIIVRHDEPRLKEMCESHFKQAADLTRDAAVAGEKALTATFVVSEVIAGGETFLNYCINPVLPLSAQPERLAELSRLARVIPDEFTCAQNYEPVVQLVDLDRNGFNEAILHTRALRCDSYGLDFGGLSIVFGKDQQSVRWHGSVVWPCFGESCDWASVWTQSTHPLVQKLDIRDAEGNTYFLVSGGYSGADANHEFIIVWRWDGAQATFTFLLELSDWCGWPITWEVAAGNRIVVAATNATSRCEATPREVYALQDDKFMLVEQSNP